MVCPFRLRCWASLRSLVVCGSATLKLETQWRHQAVQIKLLTSSRGLTASFLSCPKPPRLAFFVKACKWSFQAHIYKLIFHCCSFHFLLLFSGTSRRTKFFGTFPGNYVKRLWITLPPFYAAFQHHVCITLPKRAPQASRCPAFQSPVEVTPPPPPSLPATKPPAKGLPLPSPGEAGHLLLRERAYSWFLL